jgi:hypothetical protein
MMAIIKGLLAGTLAACAFWVFLMFINMDMYGFWEVPGKHPFADNSFTRYMMACCFIVVGFGAWASAKDK